MKITNIGKSKKLKDIEDKQGVPTGNNQKGQKKERDKYVTKKIEFSKEEKKK